MANVFLSPRKADAALVEQLAVEVRAAGHQVWFDEWAIGVGDSIVAEIDQGLAGANYLVLCHSAAGSSDWTDREWQSTLARLLAGHSVKFLPAFISGGARPAILADIAYADLVANHQLRLRQRSRKGRRRGGLIELFYWLMSRF